MYKFQHEPSWEQDFRYIRIPSYNWPHSDAVISPVIEINPAFGCWVPTAMGWIAKVAIGVAAPTIEAFTQNLPLDDVNHYLLYHSARMGQAFQEVIMLYFKVLCL